MYILIPSFKILLGDTLPQMQIGLGTHNVLGLVFCIMELVFYFLIKIWGNVKAILSDPEICEF